MRPRRNGLDDGGYGGGCNPTGYLRGIAGCDNDARGGRRIDIFKRAITDLVGFCLCSFSYRWKGFRRGVRAYCFLNSLLPKMMLILPLFGGSHGGCIPRRRMGCTRG
jgi:hypothetical protein